MSQTMELVMNVGIGLLFVVVGIALLVSIIFAAKPYDQITFATAETLRSALNEACFYGKDVEVKNVALPETGMTFLHQAMLSIIQKGDPNYLIYYEQFPVGEAISWETYLNGKMNDRIFAQIDEPSFMAEQAEKFRSTITAPGGAAADVIINNVALATGINMLTLETPEDKKSPVTGEQKNGYYALNYQPDALAKTTAKYLSCGEGNLCVKTNSGIYAYPLSECEGVIDYVQLINEKYESFADGKQSDFYFNSPCKADVTVRIEKNCHCKLVKYPVYDYDANSATFNPTGGEHKSCVDGIGNAPDVPETSFKCAVVTVKERDGCYTISPLQTMPLKIAFSTAPHPVDVYSRWLGDNAILLTTKDVVSVMNELKTKLLDIVANNWYWPWSN